MKIERVKTSEPLSDTEMLIAELLSAGWNYSGIGEHLDITRFTVKWHAQNAALKIPGDLPTQFRLVVWWRGGTLEVLGASPLSSRATEASASDVAEEEVAAHG